MMTNLMATAASTMVLQAAQDSAKFTTGIPVLDGLLVSSPVAAALMLWVWSLQADKKEYAKTNKELTAQLVAIAEKSAESSALVPDRLNRIEQALKLREG